MTRTTFGAMIALAFASAFAATWPFRGDLAESIANGTVYRPLGFAKSWRYQRELIDVAELAADPSDLLVVDGGKVRLTRDDVARLKIRSDGRRRLVVAYLSVGEVDASRAHWDDAWTAQPPDWLAGKSCARLSSQRVRYWLPGWKNVLYREPWSYLERIIAAGFDGVYLDGVDVFEAFESERPSARREMIAHVKELAAAARAMKPGFLVMTQNAEALLEDPEYRLAIDGIAKEDLLYGLSATGVRNTSNDIKGSMDFLRLLQKEGKPVFAIEYLTSARQIDQTAGELRRRGFVPAFETRDALRDAGEFALKSTVCPPRGNR